MKQATTRLILVSGTIIALTSAPASAAGRADGSFLRQVTRDYKTPHLDWATQLAGGPLRTLMIVPRNLAAREIVELAQRMELNYEAVATHSAVALANESVYEATVTGTSAQEKTREIIDKLDQHYETIVVGNVDFKILPAEAQYKILEQVASGAGLLLAYPRPLENPGLLATPTEDWKQILKTVDPSSLPGQAAKTGDKLVRTYQFGKGRIATITYPGLTPTALYGGPAFTAFEEYTPGGWQARYENNLALVGRTLQWTARRDLTTAASLTLPSDIQPGRDIPVKFQVANGPGLELRLRLRDRWNSVVWSGEMAADANPASVSMPGVAAGTYYLDSILEKDDKTQSFGVVRFDVASPLGTIKISTDKPSYESGETMEVSVSTLNALTAPAQLRLEVRDLPYGKTWHRERVDLATGQKEAKIRVADLVVPTVAGLVRYEFWQAGKMIAAGDTVAYFPRRKREIYPTLLWGSIPPYMSEAFAGQIMNSVNDPIGLTHPETGGKVGRLAALFNQRFVPYTTRIGLMAGEKGQTQSTHWLGMSKEEVDQATGGDGSFYNPAVKAFWKRNVERRVQGTPEIGPPIYTLGDENGFSYDAGYSPADETAFKEYLRSRYLTIEKLNQEWGTTYRTFDEVQHLHPDEMRKRQLFAQWYDHRRFVEKQYADVHHYLAECIKAIDPHARVGAEGSMPGDLEQTISKLDFWGPYTDSVMDEVLRSVAPNKLRSTWWGFGAATMENGPVRLWRPLLQGTVNGSAWYSSGIESFGLLSIDLSLAEYYRKIQKDLKALDRGQAQLLVQSPLKQDGIAILWSHTSYTASFMNGNFTKPGDSATAFMNFCYREGLNFDYVTSKMVGEGALGKYKVLCLFGASALSQEEKSAVEAFVKRGGTVIADINPGVLNEYCRPLPSSSLGNLFGVKDLEWRNPQELRSVAIDGQIRGSKIQFRADKAFQVINRPLFSVREDGPGTAVLLNFSLGSAASTASEQTPFDDFLRQLLRAGGVQANVKVEGLLSDQAMVRVRQNTDGLVVGLFSDKSDLGRDVTLRLPKPQWIYEVDKGLLAHTDVLPLKLTSPFKVFATYDSEQSAPRLRLDQTRPRPGTAVQLDSTLLKPATVYRLEVEGPDREIIRTRTAVCTGAALKEAGHIRFAFNDAPGQYRILLTEVGTGLQSTAALTLQTEVRS